MVTAASISSRIIDAILAEQLPPNARLGEQELAKLFGCSRTVVREAMIELSARGIVTVSSRRGWYLTEISAADARALYEAREVIETGLLRSFARRGAQLDMATLYRLRGHLEQQKAALGDANVGRRSYLLGDFHVCLAECLGNRILAAKLRDLTVLTTLFTMRHQTSGDAERSYKEHVAVFQALEAGDPAAAERRMCNHLGTWEEKVHMVREVDALESLRQALAPVTEPGVEVAGPKASDERKDGRGPAEIPATKGAK